MKRVEESITFTNEMYRIGVTWKPNDLRYLCLFTCMATRVVYLEIAFGLISESFLNALYRTASRRGVPEDMYSDNGTNFKGADNELRSLVAQMDNDEMKVTIANK